MREREVRGGRRRGELLLELNSASATAEKSSWSQGFVPIVLSKVDFVPIVPCKVPTDPSAGHPST